MSAETLEKEQFLVGLQRFLTCRLQTVSYAVAVKAQPLVSSPAMMPNTQSLLDGFLWSANDHPAWSQDCWLVLQNHVKDAVERLEETNQEYGATSAEEREPDVAFDLDLAVNRERLYNCHAVVQDVYFSFCLIDVLLKNAVDKSLVTSIEKELPRFVTEWMPLFQLRQSPWMDDAVTEYTELYLALLHSWTQSPSVAPEVIRRLEEHLRHKLKRAREAMEADEDRDEREAFHDGLQALLHTAGGGRGGRGGRQQGPGPAQAAAQGRAGRKGARTPESVEAMIRSFLNSIFPGRRTPRRKHRCPHCGAYFDTEKARNEHYRVHFYNHNTLKTDMKVVRLFYPSAADFVEHIGDLGRRGYFVKVTETLEEAYKNGGKGAVKVQRIEDLTGDRR